MIFYQAVLGTKCNFVLSVDYINWATRCKGFQVGQDALNKIADARLTSPGDVGRNNQVGVCAFN